MKSKDVIILHGWNLSGKRFTDLADLLRKKGFRVKTPDFPGFGAEPAPDEPWHIWDYAEFLHRYIHIHKIHKPLLIGHSFGGRVALAFAAKYPQKSAGIVLTGAPGFSPVPKKKMIFFLVIAKIGGTLFSLPGIRLFADYARKLLYRVAGAREFYRAEGSMRQTFKFIVQDDLSEFMRKISIPCLLVWGKDDSIVPVHVAERMLGIIKDSKLHIVQGETHAFPMQNPNSFLREISTFL